jgi:hypothetical protein
MAQLEVQIDFDKLREVVAFGVRRATVFMGLASNAAAIDPPISHVLSDRSQFQTVPVDVAPEVRAAFLQEFERWVIANAFRELAETFSLFLTEVHTVYVAFDRGTITVGDLQKIEKAFSFKGLNDQFLTLSSLLRIDPVFASMIKSVNQARNCMAHRRGIVGQQDVDEPAWTFTFHWRTFALTTPDGKDLSQLLNLGLPAETGENQAILVGPVNRSKTFAIGEPIHFARYELNEICFGMTLAMERVRADLIEFGRSKGHDIKEVSPALGDIPPPGTAME